jgi:catechol 2,3-dioxygenase-like lactoylglutathione lyase family enzyme
MLLCGSYLASAFNINLSVLRGNVGDILNTDIIWIANHLSSNLSLGGQIFAASTLMITGIDHIVLCVRDVGRTIAFYEKALGMQPREERQGKWSLHFGSNKISLQDAMSPPDIARHTVPGSGNFCVLTDDSVDELANGLRGLGIDILAGPVEREGATGKLLSIYFRDPDGNLVEVSNRL